MPLDKPGKADRRNKSEDLPNIMVVYIMLRVKADTTAIPIIFVVYNSLR